MSKWDQEYLNLCEKIIKEGKVHHNRTGDDTIRIIGHTFELDIAEEFPVLSVKQVGIKGPLIELLWIYQAHSNNVQWLRDRGVTIWDEWEVDTDGVYRQGGNNRFIGKEYARHYRYSLRLCNRPFRLAGKQHQGNFGTSGEQKKYHRSLAATVL